VFSEQNLEQYGFCLAEHHSYVEKLECSLSHSLGGSLLEVITKLELVAKRPVRLLILVMTCAS
jgi:hypothetical protein